MYLIRTAEEEIAQLYLRNKIMSFVHFYVGQEAIAVGVCDALTPEDKVLGNHRSHGHYLARGGDLKRMVCELLGKAPGSSKGKGGSMHMIDTSVNFVGSTPILGSVAPLTSGTAFQLKYDKTHAVSVGFIGDGAFEEGVVYETLNLAALFNLPMLLVLENNLYSVNSKLKDRRSIGHNVEKIVQGYGVTYIKEYRNDYNDDVTKARDAVAHIRSGKGPVVLECVAYRHMAHSAPLFDDAQGYREEDVLEKRIEKDSVKKMRAEIIANGLSEADVVAVEKGIKDTVMESIQYALDAQYPEPKELYTHLYA